MILSDILYEMIRIYFKKILILCLMIQAPFFIQAQDLDQLIAEANMLFNQQKYTESFEIYETLYEEHQVYTPAMLAKMAFIKEGLSDYPEALYFLNLYYLNTTDKSVLKKMDDLAQEHNLIGYEYTDFDFFFNIYFKYYTEIVYFFLGLNVLLLAIIIYQKRKYQRKPVGYGIMLLLASGILFYLVNYGARYNKGIITSYSYLMSAPSAGAKLVDIAERGHRVQIKNRKNIWVEIEWNGSNAFIKEHHLKYLN